MFTFGLIVGLVVGVMATGSIVLFVATRLNYGKEFGDAYRYEEDEDEPFKAYEAEPESPILKRPAPAVQLPVTPVKREYSDAEISAIRGEMAQRRIIELQKEQVEGVMQED